MSLGGNGVALIGDQERLLDIPEAIDGVEPYAARNAQVFDTHELIYTPARCK